MKRLEQLQQLQDDILDVSLAAARMLTTGGRRHSLDEVLAQFGYTRWQVRDLPEKMPDRIGLSDEGLSRISSDTPRPESSPFSSRS